MPCKHYPHEFKISFSYAPGKLLFNFHDVLENSRYLFGCFKKPPEWNNLLPERLAHLTAKEVVDFNFLPFKQFQEFYKFAVVRDPIDRLISTWKYLSPEQEFNKWLIGTATPFHEEKNYFFKDQAEFIFDENAVLLIDEIIPFAKVHLKSQRFTQYLFGKMPLSHRNASNKNSPNITSSSIAHIIIVTAEIRVTAINTLFKLNLNLRNY